MRHKSPILQAHHVPADFYCTDLTSQKDLINQQDSAVFLSLTRLSIINQVIIQPDKQSTQCYSFGNCNKREGRAEGGRSFSSMLRLQENIKKKKFRYFQEKPYVKSFCISLRKCVLHLQSSTSICAEAVGCERAQTGLVLHTLKLRSSCGFVSLDDSEVD